MNIMMVEISDYEVRKLLVSSEREIGDAINGPYDTMEVMYLELGTKTGLRGVGVNVVRRYLSSEDQVVLDEDVLRRKFQSAWEDIKGKSPFQLVGKRSRPRAHDYQSAFGGKHSYSAEFNRILDMAFWDLCGKHLDMPLYELIGGDSDDRSVPAYASALGFHEDDKRLREIYTEFKDLGFDAAKVKVGYPTVEEDLERLEIVRDVFGEDCTLMVDANEAWTPKETIRRAKAYQEADFDLFWIEDPVFREDIEGLRRVADNIPFSLSTSDYVNLEGKRRLLEHRALDTSNLRYGISNILDMEPLFRSYGVPIAIGNTPMTIGVHAGSALPEVTYLEYSMKPWETALAKESFQVEDGHAIAPDKPGHGVEISREAIEEYRL